MNLDSFEKTKEFTVLVECLQCQYLLLNKVKLGNRSMSHRVERIEVNDSLMEVFIFEPQGAGPHPGLIQCIRIPV